MEIIWGFFVNCGGLVLDVVVNVDLRMNLIVFFVVLCDMDEVWVIVEWLDMFYI